MSTPFASMAVKWALDKLSSLMVPERLTPVASSSSSSINQGMKDLQVLERTMHIIHATLRRSDGACACDWEAGRRLVNGDHLSEVGLVPVSNELAAKARELIQRFDEMKTMPHYTMNHLSPQESWTLFKRTVTTPENAIQGNLVDIAKKI
uniref:Uncharacterized protein n=1 Tax=Oryza rufipogon TaxID=4529 RepID=A0A0E0R8L7_ORYRU